jgi:hypothetical protein
MPGCSAGGKKGGEACEKDKECESHSCIDSACAEGGKAFGDDCEKDGECKSGSCKENKCAAGGNKKAPGEECDTDDECDSGKCKEGTCSEGGSSKFPRVWLGLGVQLDMYLMPSGTDVCKLDRTNAYTTSYSCVNTSAVDMSPFGNGQPKTAAANSAFPGTSGGKNGSSAALNNQIVLSAGDSAGKNAGFDQVSGGFKLGNIRILASIDYALSQNMLLGLRAGYVLFTDPSTDSPGPPFAPVHLEARFTYLVGKNALTKGGVAPMFFGGLGAGEFDAYLPVAVAVSGNPNFPGKTAYYGPNAWTTAGPVFAAAGGGVRFGITEKIGATLDLKLEAGFGGTAGVLFGVAPEAGLQFGL